MDRREADAIIDRLAARHGSQLGASRLATIEAKITAGRAIMLDRPATRILSDVDGGIALHWDSPDGKRVASLRIGSNGSWVAGFSEPHAKWFHSMSFEGGEFTRMTFRGAVIKELADWAAAPEVE